VDAFCDSGKNMLRIANLTTRSSTVIRNCIKLRENVGKIIKEDKKEISSRDENHILRLASNRIISCRKIKADLRLVALKSSI